MTLQELSANKILEMMRCKSGHPDTEGYPFTRSQLLLECRHRGKRLLEELGWPSELGSVYWNRYTFESVTLEEACGSGTTDLDNFREKLAESEEEVRVLTRGVFPENTGLECTTLKEWKNWLYRFPQARKKLMEAVRLHKGFYEVLHPPIDLTRRGITPNKEKPREGESEDKILKLAKWLGMSLEPEPLETLPEISPYFGVWLLLEHWTPVKPTLEEKLRKTKGQASMKTVLSMKEKPTPKKVKHRESFRFKQATLVLEGD